MSTTDTAPEATKAMPRPGEQPAQSASEPAFLRHDLLVPALAALALIGGWLAHDSLTRPKLATLSRDGLSFRYPAGWHVSSDSDQLPAHLRIQPIGQSAEEHVDVSLLTKPPVDGPIDQIIDLYRSREYGDLYKSFGATRRNVGGREWVRTQFAYAYKLTEGDVPKVGWGVEYAAVNGDRLYIVSVHAPEERVRTLESEILGTLAVK